MRYVVLSLALAGLCACSPPASPQASAPIGPAEAPPQVGAPSGSGAALSQDVLIGRWGDSGDCTKDVVFNTDGSFHSYTGGDGQWSLDGDIITMSGAGGVFQLRARVLDARTLELTNPDGAVFTSNRC